MTNTIFSPSVLAARKTEAPYVLRSLKVLESWECQANEHDLEVHDRYLLRMQPLAARVTELNDKILHQLQYAHDHADDPGREVKPKANWLRFCQVAASKLLLLRMEADRVNDRVCKARSLTDQSKPRAPRNAVAGLNLARAKLQILQSQRALLDQKIASLEQVITNLEATVKLEAELTRTSS